MNMDDFIKMSQKVEKLERQIQEEGGQSVSYQDYLDMFLYMEDDNFDFVQNLHTALNKKVEIDLSEKAEDYLIHFRGDEKRIEAEKYLQYAVHFFNNTPQKKFPPLIEQSKEEITEAFKPFIEFENKYGLD